MSEGSTTSIKQSTGTPPNGVDKTLSTSKFQRSGMGYLLHIDDLSTDFRLSHLKRARGELHGQLTITTKIDGIRTVNGVLHSSNFNLSSAATREKLAKTLKTRSPGVDLDWFGFLEELCQLTLANEEKGEAIELVGHLPVERSASLYAIEPVAPLYTPATIYGPGGSGKSLIAQTCGVSVAVGREIIPGIRPAIKGRVLYLDWETSREVVNERIRSIAAGGGFNPPQIYYRRCRRPLYDDAEELAGFIADHKIIFVVIDSAAAAIGHQGDFGDANEGALRLFEAINFFGRVSTLVVDHVSKAELNVGGKKVKTPYGSVYKLNMTRMAWEVRAVEREDEDDLRVAMYDSKRNDFRQHEPLALRIQWEPGFIRFFEDVIDEPDAPGPTISEVSTLSSAILELLDGSRMRGPDIARALNKNPGSVKVVLGRMKGRGQVTKDANQLWARV